jgi:hypothetical protein
MDKMLSKFHHVRSTVTEPKIRRSVCRPRNKSKSIFQADDMEIEPQLINQVNGRAGCDLCHSFNAASGLSFQCLFELRRCTEVTFESAVL